MLKNLLRKWLGIEQTDRVLALHLKRQDLVGKPMYPADDQHPLIKRGYNG